MKKELKELIENNSSALENSKKNLEAVYNIIFSNGDRVLCESNDGFRVNYSTYNEIKSLIEKAAGGLYSRIGETGSYVGIEMENSKNWIVTFWAVLRSGNRPYLINCRHPKSLADSIIKSLGIEYIVAEKKGELSGEYIEFSSIEESTSSAPDEVFENEIAISTSATTLKEVVCFYTGEEISNQILCARSIIRECPRIADHYKGSLKQLAFLPFYHIFGLVAVYFWFTFYGRTFVFLRDYAPDTILKTCRRHKVTHIFAVPMLWHTIEKQLNREIAKKGEKKKKQFNTALKFFTALQNLFPVFGAHMARKALSEATDRLFGDSVRFCISGGSYIRPTAQYLMNGMGYPMYNGYGMSEIGITSVELRKKPKHRNKGSIGHPLSSVAYSLDSEGILTVSGSSICKRMMINGSTVLIDGSFSTGDIMEEKGGYYFIKGRRGDCVIGENGENINPDTIEERFDLSSASAFSVLGLGCGSDERLSLVVSVSPYLSSARIKAITEEAYKTNETLPTALQIKDFYFTTDPIAPPTAVKVGRAYLKRAIDSGAVTLTSFSDMKATENGRDTNEWDPLSSRVRSIVAEVLDIPENKIELDTHIVSELEASSLQYFSIITALSEEFSITQYSDRENYRYTVREIAEYISENV
ncbi:MAG: AMP-binding protein [Clostridia bacterium]|nr:AMP-binding protein [Clostridia bacterium]